MQSALVGKPQLLSLHSWLLVLQISASISLIREAVLATHSEEIIQALSSPLVSLILYCSTLFESFLIHLLVYYLVPP